MLGECQEQQKEHTQCQAHQGILDWVDRAARQVLPYEERQKGQANEHTGVLHCPLDLLVQIHRLDQVHTECTVLQNIGLDVTLHPARTVRSIEIQHLPCCIEASVVNVALDGQKAAGKTWIGPVTAHL